MSAAIIHNRHRACRLVALACWLGLVLSTTPALAAEPIVLWPEGAPGSEQWSHTESELDDFLDQRVVRNVVQPTLIPYLATAQQNTGAAVIVAPGGGFKFLSIDREGTEVATWLQTRGINAFVLKYRLDRTADSAALFTLQSLWLFLRAAIAGGDDYPQAPLSPVQMLATDDALAAVRHVRAHARDWQLRADAVGILGFSAGGAVAGAAAIDGEGAGRPDFAALVYGVPPAAALPDKPPPLLFLSAQDDPLINADWGAQLVERWQAAGGSATLQLYPDGGHGFGMHEQGASTDDWIAAFHAWLMQTIEPDTH